MKNSERVVEFHRALGDGYPETPTVPPRQLLELRERLVAEEYEEAAAEFARLRARLAAGEPLGPADLVPLAHELVDLLYVTYGALAAMGVPTDEVFAEIHRANLAKSTGPRRADGKQLKPEGWQPADIRPWLAG